MLFFKHYGSDTMIVRQLSNEISVIREAIKIKHTTLSLRKHLRRYVCK